MRPNILVFYADQLRQDSLGCYGNPVALTPHLDSLARCGLRFHNHYANNTVCMPSRSSFFTGRHLAAHRVIANGIPLSETEITLPAVLAEHGYQTCSIGKIHLTPYLAPLKSGCKESWEVWRSGALADWNGPYYGFNEVSLTLGHGATPFTFGGHYARWIGERVKDPERLEQEVRAAQKAQPFSSIVPVELYPSTYVAEETIRFLRQRDRTRPFFLFASFPDPHHPFTPPKAYAERFAKCNFPPPHRREGEHDNRPVHYQEAMRTQQHPLDGGAHYPRELSAADWQQIYAATYGMVNLIDECVGRVLAVLDAEGLSANTLVVFTSDHGDFLGDHFFLYKGPYPSRALLNVPFILAGPGCRAGETQSVMSNVDVMPTLLDLVGLAAPETVQGRSFKPEVAGAGELPEAPALCCGWCLDGQRYNHQSLYFRRHRISYFPVQDDGELYDLERDPHELHNLYHEPEHGALRDELLRRLLKEVGRAEPCLPPIICPW